MTNQRFNSFTSLAMMAMCLPFATGCSIPAIQAILGLPPSGSPTPAPAISVASPNTALNISAGVAGAVRWADIAPTAGTFVNVTAQKRNVVDEDIGAPIVLVTNRDAQLDGTDDQFSWDPVGVRVGNYTIIATISAPDGQTATAESAAAFTVTTSLAVPSLTFTNPGAANVNFVAPGPLNITWTDNGNAATTAKLRLGLDLDFNHQEGDEIILATDQDLSADGNNGTFAFTGVDMNGAAVPAGSYVVFAILDDNINEIVTREATGRLVVP